MKKYFYFAALAVTALLTACSSDSDTNGSGAIIDPVVKAPEMVAEINGEPMTVKSNVFFATLCDDGEVNESIVPDNSWTLQKNVNNCDFYKYKGSYNPNPNNSHEEKEPCRAIVAAHIDEMDWQDWAQPETSIAYASYNSQDGGIGNQKEIMQPNNTVISTQDANAKINASTSSSAFRYDFLDAKTEKWYITGTVQEYKDGKLVYDKKGNPELKKQTTELTQYKLYTCNCGRDVCRHQQYIGFDINGDGKIDWINVVIATEFNKPESDKTEELPTIEYNGSIDVDIHQQEHKDWSAIKTTIHIRDVVSEVEVNIPIDPKCIAESDDFAIRTWNEYIKVEDIDEELEITLIVDCSHDNGVLISVSIPQTSQEKLEAYLKQHPEGLAVEVLSYIVNREINETNNTKTWEEIQDSEVKVYGDTKLTAQISSAFDKEKDESGNPKKYELTGDQAVVITSKKETEE